MEALLTSPECVRYNVHERRDLMEITNATNFRKNIFSFLENTIQYGEPILITTKSGNAIVVNENEYNSLLETIYLSSNPEVRDSILEGLAMPLSECIPEEEVEW